jgi:hypothetical protein
MPDEDSRSQHSRLFRAGTNSATHKNGVERDETGSRRFTAQVKRSGEIDPVRGQSRIRPDASLLRQNQFARTRVPFRAIRLAPEMIAGDKRNIQILRVFHNLRHHQILFVASLVDVVVLRQ